MIANRIILIGTNSNFPQASTWACNTGITPVSGGAAELRRSIHTDPSTADGRVRTPQPVPSVPAHCCEVAV